MTVPQTTDHQGGQAVLPARSSGAYRALGWLGLDGARPNAIAWGSIFVIGLSLFIPAFLPCVDYPQHLALADVAHRLQDPSAPEHATYMVNYFTYNGLFHILAATMARVLPIEIAGKLLFSSSLIALGLGAFSLVRALGRPAYHACFFIPLIFSFAAGWGFVNYTMGIAMAIWALVWVVRAIETPTLARLGAIGALSLLCGMTHVLATLLLCIMAVAIAPEVSWRATHVLGAVGWRERALSAVGRTVVALLPLLVGCIYCIAVYRIQYEWDPNMYRDPTVEGTAPPLWQKFLYFSAFTSGLYKDITDQILLVASIVVIVTLSILAFRAKRRAKREGTTPSQDRPIFGLLIVMTLLYLVTPMVLIGTHLIFPRLGQLVILGAVCAIPHLDGKWGERARKFALYGGAFAALNLVVHMSLFAIETYDASRVLDDAPAGRRAAAVQYDAETRFFRNGVLVHLAAYYGARKHGDWAFGFARYLSVPVRFKRESGPPWPKKGWEFTPEDYNPRCGYARAFDLVFVHAPRAVADDERAVRTKLFGQDADAVKVLSHHGNYWLFDTAGLPNDGTL